MPHAQTKQHIERSQRVVLQREVAAQPPISADNNPASEKLRIRARVRNTHGEQWGLLIDLEAPDGTPRTTILSSASLVKPNGAWLRELANYGVIIAHDDVEPVHNYLITAPVDNFARVVDYWGWHDDNYVLPDAQYGPPTSEQIIPAAALLRDNPFQVQGSLREWQEQVGRLCSGNSRLILVVSAALAGPLLTQLELEGGGVHLFGPSSIGKTTAAKIAASVCGGGGGSQGYLRSWRTTDNALELTAATFNDGLLLLDELGQVSPKAASEIPYMLTNGKGKARASRSGQRNHWVGWRLICLSTGELPLAEKIGERRGQTATDGQAVRFLDIPADAGSGHGLFEDLRDFQDGDTFCRHLEEAAEHHYGTALRAFLEAIASDLPACTSHAQLLMAAFEERVCPKSADGQVRRVCKRFALLAAAGELGIGLGILPWPTGEATRGVKRCFDAWMECRNGLGDPATKAAVQQALDYLMQHVDDFQETGQATTSTQAGYKRDMGGKTNFWVHRDVFRYQVCRGHDPNKVIAALLKLGIADADRGHRTKFTRTPEGSGRFYSLSLKAPVPDSVPIAETGM